jgi:hypothetical protein
MERIVKCPYCDKEYEADEMFPDGYDADEKYMDASVNVCCLDCEKDFKIYRKVITTYHSDKE